MKNQNEEFSVEPLATTKCPELPTHQSIIDATTEAILHNLNQWNGCLGKFFFGRVYYCFVRKNCSFINIYHICNKHSISTVKMYKILTIKMELFTLVNLSNCEIPKFIVAFV